MRNAYLKRREIRMNEQRYIYDKDIEFENSGIADRIEWEEAEHIFTVKEVCDKLNEQQAIIKQQEQSITILKQEIADAQAILEMLSENLKGWNNE